MSILQIYQLAFIATIVVTVLVAARVKRQQVPATDHIQASSAAAQIISRPVAVSLDIVKERIRKLDQLFDDNVLSVDEYVELRRRITGESDRRSPNLPLPSSS